MPTSIYDNGGFIGKTLDFSDNTLYPGGNKRNSGIWSLSAVLESAIEVAPPTFTLSLVASTTSTTNTIVVPTITAGDLAIMLNVAQNPDGVSQVPPATVVPSGFTVVHNYTAEAVGSGDDVQRSIASTKILTGTESGTTLNLLNGDRDSAVLMILRKSTGAVSSVTVRALSGGGSQSDPTPITTDLTSYGKPLIFIASYGGDGISAANATSTPTLTQIVAGTNSNQLIAGYKIYNPADALESVTIDQPDIDVNIMTSFVLEVR